MTGPTPFGRWGVVVASACGLAVGPPIHFFTFGVFIKPLSASLGLSRSALSFAFLIGMLLTALTCPLMGILVDRVGVRRVLLIVLPLFALATALLSLIPSSMFWVYVLFALQGILAAGQSPATYPRAIAASFDKQRGLALGIAMSGVGLGTMVMPRIASFLIDETGWRNAYLGLSLAVLAVGFLPVLLFLRESPTTDLPLGADARNRVALLSQAAALRAFRGWRFWALAVAFLLGGAAINGTLNSVVVLLTDRGLTLAAATLIFSASGLAALVGRLVCGFSLDIAPGTIVAAVFFMLPATGVALMLLGTTQASVFVGVVLCGLGVGAEVDLMPFLSSRYFGLPAFGKIHGLMFGLFTIGSGVGPYLMSLSHDTLHSYDAMLLVFVSALGLSSILFLRLGSYPTFHKARTDHLVSAVE